MEMILRLGKMLSKLVKKLLAEIKILTLVLDTTSSRKIMEILTRKIIGIMKQVRLSESFSISIPKRHQKSKRGVQKQELTKKGRQIKHKKNLHDYVVDSTLRKYAFFFSIGKIKNVFA